MGLTTTGLAGGHQLLEIIREDLLPFVVADGRGNISMMHGGVRQRGRPLAKSRIRRLS